MINKKIRNATITEQKGITFKSILEKTIYNLLIKEFKVQYEPKQHVLWDTFIPITPFYDKETDKQKYVRDPHNSTPRLLTLKKNKSIIGIRYTPDFYFEYNGVDIYIEAKGKENDVFYIKKKMFQKYLDDIYLKTGKKSIFFEVYSKKQCIQAIDIIKNGQNSTNKEIT